MLDGPLCRGRGFVALRWWHRADAAQPPSQLWDPCGVRRGREGLALGHQHRGNVGTRCWMDRCTVDVAPSPSGGGTARTRRNHRLTSGTPDGVRRVSGGFGGLGLSQQHRGRAERGVGWNFVPRRGFDASGGGTARTRRNHRLTSRTPDGVRRGRHRRPVGNAVRNGGTHGRGTSG